MRTDLGSIGHLFNAVVEEDFTSLPVSGVSVDSRTVSPGELFFALPGQRTDGHCFVSEALARGASAAVVKQPLRTFRGTPVGPEYSLNQGPLLVVEDPLEALKSLAAWWRECFQVPVIGVTGSSGKTSTKDMLAAVLMGRFKTLKNEGSYNNELGLPLTILKLDDHEALVVEMAMRARGQIAELCQVARPTIGVVTNVGLAHLELLGSKEAIFAAKSELLEALPPETGLAVLNIDDPWCRRLGTRAPGRVIYYGLFPEAEVRAMDLEYGPEGMRFKVIAWGRSCPATIPLWGEHNVVNSLAALAVGLHLGLELGDAVARLARVLPGNGRLQTLAGINGSTILNDTYNANPDSVLAALRVLRRLPAGRRIALLGDMLELGPRAGEEHYRLGGVAAASHVDMLLAVGQFADEVLHGARASGLAPASLESCPDARSAGYRLSTVLEKGDLVLVKGSRAMKMEAAVELLRSPE